MDPIPVQIILVPLEEPRYGDWCPDCMSHSVASQLYAYEFGHVYFEIRCMALCDTCDRQWMTYVRPVLFDQDA